MSPAFYVQPVVCASSARTFGPTRRRIGHLRANAGTLAQGQTKRCSACVVNAFNHSRNFPAALGSAQTTRGAERVALAKVQSPDNQSEQPRRCARTFARATSANAKRCAHIFANTPERTRKLSLRVRCEGVHESSAHPDTAPLNSFVLVSRSTVAGVRIAAGRSNTSTTLSPSRAADQTGPATFALRVPRAMGRRKQNG